MPSTAPPSWGLTLQGNSGLLNSHVPATGTSQRDSGHSPGKARPRDSSYNHAGLFDLHHTPETHTRISYPQYKPYSSGTKCLIHTQACPPYISHHQISCIIVEVNSKCMYSEHLTYQQVCRSKVATRYKAQVKLPCNLQRIIA